MKYNKCEFVTNPEYGALRVGKLPSTVAGLHTRVPVCSVLTECVLLLRRLEIQWTDCLGDKLL